MSWTDKGIESGVEYPKLAAEKAATTKPTLMDAYLAIPRLPQRQDSTADQLFDLHAIACKLGMYDAADTIKNILVNSGRMVR